MLNEWLFIVKGFLDLQIGGFIIDNIKKKIDNKKSDQGLLGNSPNSGSVRSKDC